MSSLRQLLSNSIGLKIAYFGFAAYALHTLVKFYLPQSDSPSLLNTLIVIIGLLGQLGLMAALISMIFTGVRGIRRNGIKTWWSLWAIIGTMPFVGLAITLLSFSMLVKDAQNEFLDNKFMLFNIQRMEKKINEMRAKNTDPRLISKLSQSNAKNAYYYKGDIVEYSDVAGNLIKYQPTEKEIMQRKDMVEAPQKIKEAQKDRFLQIIILFVIPLLTVATALLIPMKRKI